MAFFNQHLDLHNNFQPVDQIVMLAWKGWLNMTAD